MLELTGFQFCPRCGQKSLTDHGPKAMACLACGMVYYHNAASAVAGIIQTPVGIVLVRRQLPPHAGSLDLPGGFLEYEESYEEALTREVYEELTIDIANLSYFCSFPNQYRYRDVSYFTADVVFLCDAPRFDAVGSPVEISEILVLPVDRIQVEEIAFSSMRKAISLYQKLKGVGL